jgi:hypothetical protein
MVRINQQYFTIRKSNLPFLAAHAENDKTINSDNLLHIFKFNMQ